MAQSGQLKVMRGRQKAALTRISKFVEKVDVANVNDVLLEELKSRKDILKGIFTKFQEIQDELELSQGMTSEDETEIEEFETKYHSAIARIGSILKGASVTQRQNKTPDGSESESEGIQVLPTPERQSNTHVELNTPFMHSQIHLPQMKLPTFNGDYHTWVAFRDSFVALVDSNPVINNIQKLYHLRSCLSGEALDTIRSIPVTAENYDLSWKLLQERFQRNHIIIFSHVKSILNIKRVTRESSGELRDFYNEIHNNLEALKNLNQPVEYWDTLLIPIITERLDPATRREWEGHTTMQDAYTIEELFKVIRTRCEILEKLEVDKKSVDPSSSISHKHRDTIQNRSHRLAHIASNSGNYQCTYCKGNHQIFYCPTFLNLTVTQRLRAVKQNNLCLNCLRATHQVPNCKMESTCKKCGKKHNTLLHQDSDHKKLPEENSNNTSKSNELTHTSVSTSVAIKNTSENSIGLLSTAIIYIEDSQGKMHQCRALLDCGAMNNIISQEFVSKVGLKTSPSKIMISGIGQSAFKSTKTVAINIKSKFNHFSSAISCIVLEKITTTIPVQSFERTSLRIPKNIQLADPNFNKSRQVDLLLGSEVFWQLLRPRKRTVPGTQIILQDTELGWVLGGKLQLWGSSTNKIRVNCLSINKTLENQMRKFWEIEDEQTNEPKTANFCDNHFRNTVGRDKDGRFIVKIPFKENVKNLGNSRDQVERRFYSLEKRLAKNQLLHEEYNKVLQEYLDLGHMSLYDETQDKEELNYYIPHLAVIRKHSLTTKIRVVFDASMKTDSGISLNDVQHAGPTIQNDLISLLIRFRVPKFVMTADICKMYRMVWLHPDERKFHRILWRQNPLEKLKCYELKTVTFGTTAAPYLAVRCLHHLADEYQSEYPEACQAIRSNFYVDDFLYGAQTEDELIKIQQEVSKILRGAGFELRKWLCNNTELSKKFYLNDDMECSLLHLGEKETSKTLGVAWNAASDQIQYCSDNFRRSGQITKRTILSEIAQIFDPLCLLGPKIVLGKILMQELWQERIDWDSEVPPHIIKRWTHFREDLQALNTVIIPRHVSVVDPMEIELHGFGDASQKAYGAAIYIRSKSAGGQILSRLLCSRSRVAPLKQQTLPRLELCAAVLVAQLADKVRQNLTVKVTRCCYWTDSTITLAWIKACPSKWKTFVSNRVSEIQRLTKTEEWSHISTHENPADILSRGATISDLIQRELWWRGPSWLQGESYSEISIPNVHEDEIPEKRTCIHLNTQALDDNFLERITNFQSLSKSKRVIAYCFRFKDNCKSGRSDKFTGPISTKEMEKSLFSLIKLAQQESFPAEYQKLVQNKPLSQKSPLLQLNPFLDENKIMRVGGRIENSPCDYDKRHPIIIPAHSNFAKLIFKDAHERYFHCGATQLLAAVREHYWPIRGRNMAKEATRKCRVCFLSKPKAFQYQMGNLPTERISPSHPFTHVGVDYAGPILIKDRITRGAKMVKAYICIFVCFSTKAIHLELVSDLTTQCFLACLKRFVSRRGKPTCIYSDNATNFRGADAELKKLYNFIQQRSDAITDFLSNQNITWKFIPARAPTFGGLWEAGVKKVKHHLRRILGEAKLNFEEYMTILCQIECVLNSRPLCPLSDDPNGPQPLTPGHFLILKSPMSIPENVDYTKIPEGRLTRFQRLQQLLQHFWSRWHKEYLSELQQRVKWQRPNSQTPQIGDIVAIKEDTTPPMRWSLGKIMQLHPGSDGVTRVVTVKLNNQLVKRPVSKLCPLPKDSL